MPLLPPPLNTPLLYYLIFIFKVTLYFFVGFPLFVQDFFVIEHASLNARVSVYLDLEKSTFLRISVSAMMMIY